jgi:hypothetical protein
MGLEDLSNDELVRLRRSLPTNSAQYRKVCAEIMRRNEDLDEDLFKDFLGYEMILS